jgi:dolichyl-phosphate-mannose--protein O-mannosyl transferase
MPKETKKKKPEPPQEPGQEPAEKSHHSFDRLDFFILLGILLVSLFVRAYGLSHPARIYFDETHYVPAARAYLSPTAQDPNYIHPPVAKEIMAFFMRIFGDWAVGWRAGSLFLGMVMIVVMYLLGLSMFKNRFAAAVSCYLVGVEFLHIAQSRIATLDIYIACFILLGFYFSWLYIDSRPDGGPGGDRRSYRHLMWSAFFFGLATAVKLSGLGGAAGAFLFIALALWVEDRKIPIRQMVAVTIIFAVVIGAVFLVCHAPHFAKGGSADQLLYNRTFKFHYTEKFTHPYLSQMWQWPIVHRPIWYMWEKDEDTQTINGIIAIGNLLFWWSFIPVLLDMLYNVPRTKDRRQIFILCGYLSLYLFWLSSLSNFGGKWHLKGGFFYYMTPCVPFMALGMADTLKDLQDSKLGRVSTYLYLGGLAVFLIAFFPILVGTPIHQSYFDKIFKLNVFKSWL